MAARSWTTIAVLLVVVTAVLAGRPGNRPSSSASAIRWNGCASNDNTYAILSIQDGTNPRSTFAHSGNANNVWTILACDITVPGTLVMQFGREIVVGASVVSRANAIRLNQNSDGVQDLEFNKNGNWVSLTGLTATQNSPGTTTNIVTRNNLVSPLNSATSFGVPWASNKNNPAANCRNGPKVVKGPTGAYSTLLTARSYSTGVAKSVVAFTCNYDTDVTATAICANGVYQIVVLTSATAQSFTGCTLPEANDFDWAQNQWVISTNCGPNLCSADFTTCTPLLGAPWMCESGSDPTQITPLVQGAMGVVTANGASTNVVLPGGFTYTFAGVVATKLWIYPQGLVSLGNAIGTDPGYRGSNPYPTTANTAYIPVFNVAAATANLVLYQITGGNTITIQWLFSQTNPGSQTAFYSAQLVLIAGQPPAISYVYYGDPGAMVTFDSLGLPFNQQYGCFMGLTADINAVVPFGTTGFALAGLDPVGRFRLLTNDPTSGFVPYYYLIKVNVVPILGRTNGVPPLVATEQLQVQGAQGLPLRYTRCCLPGTRVAAAQNAAGTSAVVVYAGVSTGFNVEIYARFLSPGMTNWQPNPATTGAALTSAYGGVIGDITVNGFPETNIDLRGLVVTWVTPPTMGAAQQPFVVLSKQVPACRTPIGGTIVDQPTVTGALFEYYALVCRDPLCATVGTPPAPADIRILADSSQLASGNLAEVFVNAAPIVGGGGALYGQAPEPDLLSVSISQKTGLPVIAVGSTAGLPVLIECLDYQCNGAQLTVADDYLAGHFGEGFVVAGSTQLTVVSQAAWAMATESKPFAQRWTAYTTAPDGLTSCTESNAGKSFNIVGRVYLCTRLPRTPFSPSTFPPTVSTVRPLSTALFSWAEIGGRLRLYASENAA